MPGLKLPSRPFFLALGSIVALLFAPQAHTADEALEPRPKASEIDSLKGDYQSAPMGPVAPNQEPPKGPPPKEWPKAYRERLVDQSTGRDPFFLGHLMTPTVGTLRENQWTVGTMALGYGFTNEVMLATSPWLMAFYNLQNWALRYRSPSLDPTWGLQAAYFQSDPKLGKTYEMRATGAWLLWRKRFTSSYRLVLSLNNFYFFDDTRPFSLRRWSLGSRTDEKSQWTFSTLHEMGTGGPIRLFVEAGILGFTYSNPNYHFGASGAYRWKGGYIQFGLSATGYLSNINKSAYNQVYNELNGTGATISFESVYRNSVAVHPEVQVQFLF